jgi:hypothetical protein
MTGWLTAWLSVCLTGWLTLWQTIWLAGWLTDCLSVWPAGWLSDRLSDLLVDWLIVWMSVSLTDWIRKVSIKLIIARNILAFYVLRSFSTIFTRTQYWILSIPIFFRCILMLSLSIFRSLDCSLPFRFFSQVSYEFFIALILVGEQYKWRKSWICL